MKRYLIVVALLALLTPVALLAQGEEMTLEDLAEAVQSIGADLGTFARELARVKDRVSTIEEQLEALETSEKAVVPADTGEPCIVISSAGSMMSLGNQLRPETLNQYLNKFGDAVGDVSVKYARFHPQDGILEVRYTALMDFMSNLEIVERWRGCEFLGVEFERGG